MPVLLLAQGDSLSKDKLKRAIVARYGLRPPAIERLRIGFKGRARLRLGPIVTWVPVEACGLFYFPTAMRWDFTVRAVGVAIGSGIEAFDGQTYRRVRGGRSVDMVGDADHIQSMQRRLWALAAVFLTPLGESFVRLSGAENGRLDVTNTHIGSTISLHLRPDDSLEHVEVDCLNPDTERQQRFTLRLSQDQTSIDEFMLPCKISAFWDDEPYFEIEPVRVEADPAIPDSVFALAD